jgi:hypothetical protein
MATKKFLCTWLVGSVLGAMALGLTGCGDDGGGSGGSGGGTATGTSACNAECDGQAEKGCLIVTSVEECKTVCAGLRQLPEACFQALDATSQCRVENGPMRAG